MDASRQNWIAQQHGADATIDGLGQLPHVSLLHGQVLAIALDESVTEEETRGALGDAYEVISIEHAPETRDRYVLARRTVTKARKR